MSEEVKKSLFVQGSILAAAGIITKLIGFIYRIPMANILGDQGNGIYSVAFGIYNIALTLSSYSLPQAVSKLVAEKAAVGQERNKVRIFMMAFLFAIVAGLLAFSLLWFGADGLEHLYNRRGLARPLRILAPTTFVVALLGVFRGFFQGHRNMVPTAISQIVEQIINAVVSVVAAYSLTRAHMGTPDEASFGAAGGTMGTLSGAAAALLFFLLLTMLDWKKMNGGMELDGHEDVSIANIYRAIFLTVIPIILSQTIYQIGNTIDDLIFSNMMAAQGNPDAVVASLQGVFHTQYLQLINLPVAIATSMAASTLPTIAAAVASGERETALQRSGTMIKFNMSIAIPSAVGLAVLGKPIVTLLFPRLMEYRDLAAMLLLTGSSAVVFYALSTISSSILQGSNHMNIPVAHSAISLVVHIALIYGLLRCTRLGIYAILIGNVTFPLLVCLLNMRSIEILLGRSWDVKKTFLIPLGISAVMGVIAWGVFRLCRLLPGHSMAVSLLIALSAAILVYGFLLLKSGSFSKQELLQFPMGGRLVRFARFREEGR